MLFGVAEIIYYLSQFMTLEPGDLINTGTPPAWPSGVKSASLPAARGRRGVCNHRAGTPTKHPLGHHPLDTRGAWLAYSGPVCGVPRLMSRPFMVFR